MSQLTQSVTRYALTALYLFGITFCVPLSLFVWFIRNRFFNEKSVAGVLMLVVIIHPELWNGGSDRCTIALLNHFRAGGHRVVWLTTMIDKYWENEDFSNVEVHEVRLPLHPGDWFSQNVALGYHLIFSKITPDLIVMDHSASCVPMLKWNFPNAKLLFYCHFPQQLVTPERFFLYRWYSSLISIIEDWLFKYVDVIMVNSEFTAKNFRAVMPAIPAEKVRVVYPPCDVDSLSISTDGGAISRKARPQNPQYIFLSMNRFWPEKRLDIILDAAVILKQRGISVKIKLAGSVMPHIPESQIYFNLLKTQCSELGLEDMVEFIISPSEAKKFELYRQCDSVLYTPPMEHFGIVPIEALEQRRPVIVINSGGPAETVIEGVTGSKIAYPCGTLLANAMTKHIKKNTWEHLDLDEYFVAQRQRFEREYSAKGFSQRLDDAIVQLLPSSTYSRVYERLLPLPSNLHVNATNVNSQRTSMASYLPVVQNAPSKTLSVNSTTFRQRRMA